MITTYFMNLIMGNVFKSKINPSIPTNYYLGLSTTLPTVSGTNVSEPSGGSYARVNITSSLDEPDSGLITNDTAISFAQSTSSWGTVQYYVIYDSSSGGNLLLFGSLTNPKTVDSDTIITIPAGELDLQLSNPS